MKKSNHTNVNKMCMCVRNGMMVWLIPCHGSSLLLCFSWTWAIFFLTCLVSMWHTFFGHASFIFDMPFWGMWHTFFGYASFFIYIARTIYNMERVIMDQTRNFYCMDEWWIMLIPSVGISHMKWTCTWSWSQSMKRLLLGSQNLTKLNKVTSSIWIGFFFNTHHMALVGIYHHWGTCLYYFILQK